MPRWTAEKTCERNAFQFASRVNPRNATCRPQRWITHSLFLRSLSWRCGSQPKRESPSRVVQPSAWVDLICGSRKTNDYQTGPHQHREDHTRNRCSPRGCMCSCRIAGGHIHSVRFDGRASRCIPFRLPSLVSERPTPHGTGVESRPAKLS